MKSVTIFTGKNCSYCAKTKEFFKEHKVEYIEYNVSEDAKAKQRLFDMGVRSVPLIIIDGVKTLGFDEVEMMKQLRIR